MPGFYTELLTDNTGGFLSFDVDVLSYDKAVIVDNFIQDDGGTNITITVNQTVSITASRYESCVLIDMQQLLLLEENEQNLLVQYEQTPFGRRV